MAAREGDPIARAVDVYADLLLSASRPELAWTEDRLLQALEWARLVERLAAFPPSHTSAAALDAALATRASLSPPWLLPVFDRSAAASASQLLLRTLVSSLVLRHGAAAESLLEALCLPKAPEPSLAAVGQKRGRGDDARPLIDRMAVELVMRVLAETAQRTDSSAGDSDFSIAQRQPAADASARIAAAVAALAAAEPPLHALSHAAAKRLAARAIAPPPGKRTAPPTRVTAQHGGALLSGVDAAVAQAAEDAAAFLAHPAALAAAAAAQALLQAMSAPGVGGSAAQPSPQPNICCSCCSVSAPEACCSRTVAWTLPALAPPPPDDESWLVDGAAHAEQAGPSGQDHGSAHELSRTRLVALACVLVLAYGAEAGSGGEEPPAKRPARGWAEWGDGGGDGAASWSSGSESDLEPQRTGSAASELTARCPCCSGRGLPRGPLVSAGPCPARSPGGLCLGAVGALLLWVSDGGCFNPSNSREGLAEPIRAPCSHDATCRAPAALRCKARRFSLLEVAPPLAAAASAAHGGVLQRYIDTILHGRQAGSGGGGDAMVTTAVEERRPPLEGLSGATEAADRVRHLLALRVIRGQRGLRAVADVASALQDWGCVWK